MNGTVIKKFLAVRQVIKNSRQYLLPQQIFYRKQSLGAPEQHHLLLVLSDSMFQAVYSRARALSPGFFPSFPPKNALYQLKAKKQASTLRFQMIAIVCIDLVVSGGECFGVL